METALNSLQVYNYFTIFGFMNFFIGKPPSMNAEDEYSFWTVFASTLYSSACYTNSLCFSFIIHEAEIIIVWKSYDCHKAKLTSSAQSTSIINNHSKHWNASSEQFPMTVIVPHCRLDIIFMLRTPQIYKCLALVPDILINTGQSYIFPLNFDSELKLVNLERLESTQYYN